MDFVWQRAFELFRHSLLQALRHDRVVPVVQGVGLATSSGAGVMDLDVRVRIGKIIKKYWNVAISTLLGNVSSRLLGTFSCAFCGTLEPPTAWEDP